MEFNNSFSTDRESAHLDWINIILIGIWRVIIRCISKFIIFDGLYLAAADLVIDVKLDPPSVLELVERVVGQEHELLAFCEPWSQLP